jgi:hypothetical protein
VHGIIYVVDIDAGGEGNVLVINGADLLLADVVQL